jgi:uncharacterized protein (TIGR04255 family)
MKRMDLSHKPLVEALFEFHWKIQEEGAGLKKPSRSGLLIGAFYERLIKEYPFYEPLPAASLPTDMAENIPQHRFRVKENEWPLVQIGPGILSVNETTKYTWEDFVKRVNDVMDIFYTVYPLVDEKINPSFVVLRYIDSIPFDFTINDALDFASTKMHLNVKFADKIISESAINKTPKALDLRFSFDSNKPKGDFAFRLYNSTVEKKDFLSWDTFVKTKIETANDTLKWLKKWLEEAHELNDSWFFSLIEGELLEKFK